MKHHTSSEQQIDDATVQRYFNGAGGNTAATLSMMAHEHNLPASASRYRFSREILTIRDWLDAVGDSGRVLDVGCGAGAWAEIFAGRYQAVIGIERSSLMVQAARKRMADLPNVEIFEGDGRDNLPEGPFDMIFLGGLCMYLTNTDVVALLHSLQQRLGEGGSIILRESFYSDNSAIAIAEFLE